MLKNSVQFRTVRISIKCMFVSCLMSIINHQTSRVILMNNLQDIWYCVYIYSTQQLNQIIFMIIYFLQLWEKKKINMTDLRLFAYLNKQSFIASIKNYKLIKYRILVHACYSCKYLARPSAGEGGRPEHIISYFFKTKNSMNWS